MRNDKEINMSEILIDYYDALDRLKKGCPIRIAKGSKITNDAVSMEAGRKKGTIKRSRPLFKELIAEIGAAAGIKKKPEELGAQQLLLAKADAKRYRALWEEAVAREVSLVNQLWQERDEWAREKSALTGEKVSSILTRKLQKSA